MNISSIAIFYVFSCLVAAQAQDQVPAAECAHQAEERVQPKTEAIPKAYNTEIKVVIKMEQLKRDADGNYIATFRLINPGKEKLSYYTFPDGSPKTDTQVRRDGQWDGPHILGNADFREFSLDAGQSTVFTEALDGADLPARIGIMCWFSEAEAPKYTTIWSDPVER